MIGSENWRFSISTMLFWMELIVTILTCPDFVQSLPGTKLSFDSLHMWLWLCIVAMIHLNSDYYDGSWCLYSFCTSYRTVVSDHALATPQFSKEDVKVDECLSVICSIFCIGIPDVLFASSNSSNSEPCQSLFSKYMCFERAACQFLFQSSCLIFLGFHSQSVHVLACWLRLVSCQEHKPRHKSTFKR